MLKATWAGKKAGASLKRDSKKLPNMKSKRTLIKTRGKSPRMTRSAPMKHYVGLDVSMKETFICIEDDLGRIVYQGHSKTDPERIAERLKKSQLAIERVGIESGSISHWLVDNLKKWGIPAICIDARKMAAVLSVQVNKTDKNDARGIAQAMRCGLYKEVEQKSQRAIEINTLMGCRKVLVEQKIQTTNAIRGFLKTYGIRLGATTDANFVQKAKEALSDEYSIAKMGIEALLDSLTMIYKKLKQLTEQVGALAESNDDAKRLMGISGIGSITAMSYIAEIDNPMRFTNARAVGAYLGMTPTQYSSGEIKRQGRVSKCGSSEVRSLLTEAGIVILTRTKSWSKLKAWGLKIQRKKALLHNALLHARPLSMAEVPQLL
jgi:transposase